jgi:hypothetical protein
VAAAVAGRIGVGATAVAPGDSDEPTRGAAEVTEVAGDTEPGESEPAPHGGEEPEAGGVARVEQPPEPDVVDVRDATAEVDLRAEPEVPQAAGDAVGSAVSPTADDTDELPVIAVAAPIEAGGPAEQAEGSGEPA